VLEELKQNKQKIQKKKKKPNQILTNNNNTVWCAGVGEWLFSHSSLIAFF